MDRPTAYWWIALVAALLLHVGLATPVQAKEPQVTSIFCPTSTHWVPLRIQETNLFRQAWGGVLMWPTAGSANWPADLPMDAAPVAVIGFWFRGPGVDDKPMWAMEYYMLKVAPSAGVPQANGYLRNRAGSRQGDSWVMPGAAVTETLDGFLRDICGSLDYSASAGGRPSTVAGYGGPTTIVALETDSSAATDNGFPKWLLAFAAVPLALCLFLLRFYLGKKARNVK